MRSTNARRTADLRERVTALLSGSFLRFFAASLFGLVLDVALAAVLNRYAGLSLILSAALSLTVAAAVMYFVHEHWTFQEGERRLSAKRMIGTILSALVALAVRIACLYGTSTLIGLGEAFALPQLLFATGVSFILNYLVVRRIVGGRRLPISAP